MGMNICVLLHVRSLSSLTLGIKYLCKLSYENFKEHTHLPITMSDLFHKTGAIYTIYTDICFIFRLNERWQSAHTVWCAEWACHGWDTLTDNNHHHHHCFVAAENWTLRYNIMCVTAPSRGGFEAPSEFKRSKLTWTGLGRRCSG